MVYWCVGIGLRRAEERRGAEENHRVVIGTMAWKREGKKEVWVALVEPLSKIEDQRGVVRGR